MTLEMLKCKIHRATVTEADLNYEGSIGIDAALLAASGILEFERVEIYNITNGERFATYAIELPKGSGGIQINGAAARLCQKGDLVIICAYCRMDEAEAMRHKPRVILVDEKNQSRESRVESRVKVKSLDSNRSTLTTKAGGRKNG